jgi:hypothetical protein
MGLDMYLYLKKEEYVSRYSKSKNLRREFPKAIRDLGITLPDLDSVCRETLYEIGYWRKANEIHAWILNKCGPRDRDGDVIDDCRDIFVSVDALEELRDTCKAVLEDKTKAEALLPTQSGFFFGSTEYDEYYFDDLKDTIKTIEPAIELIKALTANKHKSGEPYYSIIYHASW